MTAQLRERLLFNGEEYGMATEPLKSYLQQNNIDLESYGRYGSCTACWRNYFGTWTIRDKKLYLTKLRLFGEKDEFGGKGDAAFTDFPTSNIKRSSTLMDRLFPNQQEVFAEWFSGEIRVPCGEMLEYVHLGYESLYEKDLVLVFEKGVLVKQDEVDNTSKYQEILRKREQEEREYPAREAKKKREEKIISVIGITSILLIFIGVCIGIYYLIKCGTVWAYIILTLIVCGVLFTILFVIKEMTKK